MKPHLPLFIGGGKKNPDNSSSGPSMDLQRVLLAAGTIVVLSFLLSIHLLPARVDLQLYDEAHDNIYAQKTVRYQDVSETELRRERAAASVGRVFDPLPNAANQAVAALKTVFQTVEEVRYRFSRLPVQDRVAHVKEGLSSLLGTQPAESTFSALVTADARSLRDMQDDTLRLLTSVMSSEIREDPSELRAARRHAAVEAGRQIQNPARAAIARDLVQALVRPNQVYNEQRTLALQEKARNAVQPSYALIMRGELVIGKGDTVYQEHLRKLEALGLRHPKLDYRSVASMTLLVCMVVLLVTAYLKRYHPDIFASTKTLALLALLVIFSTLALRIGGSMLGIKLRPEHVGYLGVLWVVTAGMFITVLVNQQVAVLVTSMLSIVLSLLLNNELKYASTALLTSVTGIYSVANIRNRQDLLRAGGALAGVGVLLVWILGGIGNDAFQDMLAGTFWAGVVIPLGSISLFFFGTVFLERPFGRTTHISLLELGDTNKPLLRQLMVEAPGTLSHSMAVGHLAETAAEAIGADSLVARIAAYYHDIGKLRRPHFFIENQCVENVHDNMNPTLSTLVITSHIKDGVEIAREHRLPKIVQDVIAQHHGTSLVQYFYNQFADEHDPSTAVEQQFRYGGPKPQTKEAAIVMLSDSVEAASRAMLKPTPAKIEMLVNRVIAGRLRDGQLDECELTFKELSAITEAFVRALTGTMHARIEYPDGAGAEGRKLAANGNSDSEPSGETGEPETDTGSGAAAAQG